MKLISANWLLKCDDDFTIIENGAIAFDEHIIDIGTIEEFQLKYKDTKIEYLGDNSVIMPGLINTHVHLEFSANKTTLKYGNFVKWLFSVMEHREELIEKATKQLIDKELSKMISNGTTTIGAISSYGFDMESCIESPLNVVYFTEVLGSKAEMIDTLFVDFKAKLQSAIAHTSNNFIPAIAVHSPYSTHPFLIREVLKIAKKKNMAVSAHFQESKAENDWLNYSTGEFESFFKDMLDQHKSLMQPSEFLNLFKNIKHLSFTHCVEANEKELAQIKELGATITHCPNSNRLLNNSILNMSYLKDISLSIGTDGLSSNNTLNMFEEIRNAFFMHTNLDPNHLAQKLILASTQGGANALGLNKGILEKGYDADIITFNLPDKCNSSEDVVASVILHTTKTTHTYIKGIDELNK
ncbi:MAG: cytosine/adenosine deaminase-related metal-dependent hydrolase [Arcobacteraceae bacterium]|jgi:cytosine/adenosine deaminase-related metal-dependent hydrolase